MELDSEELVIEKVKSLHESFEEENTYSDRYMELDSEELVIEKVKSHHESLEEENTDSERYMELDSEELVIEKVKSHHESFEEENIDSDCGNGGAPGSAVHASDPMLASLDDYLEEVEDTQNRRSFLKGGAILDIPICYVEGEVLFPGKTLYLKVMKPKIATIERALKQADASSILGVVSVYRDSCHGEMRFATTGTIAELCGEIQIIHEDKPLRTPPEAVGKQAPLRKSHNLNHLQNEQNGIDIFCDDSDALPDGSFTSDFSATERRWNESALASSSWGSKPTELASDADESDYKFQFGHPHLSMFPNSQHSVSGENSETKVANKSMSDIPTHEGVAQRKGSKSSLYQGSRTFWPSWVYHMYDSYCLAEKVAGMWKKIFEEPSMDCLVKNPDILSFHIASTIPVSVPTKQELLDIDGISYRLRREIELLESFDCSM